MTPAALSARTFLLLVGLSIAAAAGLLRLTEKGIGVGSDSAVYMAGAENLKLGRGFVWIGGDQAPRPINHYPPLYSLGLSFWLRWLPSPDQAARAFNALLMGANTFLVGLLAGLLSSSGVAAVLGALLFAVSEETLSIHSWAMSDALYLFFALVCVVGSVRAVLNGGKGSSRILMWGGSVLGFLTRFVGLSLLTIPLAATLLSSQAPRAKAKGAALGLGAAILPSAAWLGRNFFLTGSLTNRRLGLFVQTLSWWQENARLMEAWFIPGRVLNLLAEWNVPPGAVLAGGTLVALVLIFRFKAALGFWPLERRLAWLVAFLLIPSHLAAVAISTWFSYPGPDVNTRTLAPVFVGALALLVASLGIAAGARSRAAKAAAVILAAGFLLFKGYANRDLVARLSKDGQGYTSAAWEKSQTVRALQQLAPALVYSNDIGAVYYFTGMPAYDLPARYDPITGQERAGYHAEYCLMRKRLAEGKGALVLFSPVPSLAEWASREDIVVGLQVLDQGPDGAIFSDGDSSPEGCGLDGTEGREAQSGPYGRGGPGPEAYRPKEG